ncbi:hypothetical protein [Jonesia denitrificans]|uniref:Uncharacterized protein n=1 Tax=Jonesia denitrificans (strain ATCC 14870 / DSM 20603 / BCRC 15368 / CIP 55.134 / JCM 11481 / NBRC 15587 / NCTC 10816 / Prevot 55134) TaxID=471856 RepID=C7R4R3_JONDD|nr:hypothetical protein [Jonesia denitrificans]ACV07686.1 hypothetical protein Jden_0007 [Jonesia denitrificans DSM 20603]
MAVVAVAVAGDFFAGAGLLPVDVVAAVGFFPGVVPAFAPATPVAAEPFDATGITGSPALG